MTTHAAFAGTRPRDILLGLLVTEVSYRLELQAQLRFAADNPALGNPDNEIALVDDRIDLLKIELDHTNENAIKIIVTKRGDDFHASLEDTELWGCGRTDATAIGDLAVHHSEAMRLGDMRIWARLRTYTEIGALLLAYSEAMGFTIERKEP